MSLFVPELKSKTKTQEVFLSSKEMQSCKTVECHLPLSRADLCIWSRVCPPWGASQVTLVVKNPLTNSGDIRDVGSIPRWGRSGGGHGSPLQYSHLENPVDRGT